MDTDSFTFTLPAQSTN